MPDSRILAAHPPLSINGVDLSYVDAGGGRRAVLLIHGHPFNRSMWTPQVSALKAEHRVVVPDLRGYGESSLPAGCQETTLIGTEAAALRDGGPLGTGRDAGVRA